MNFQIAHLIFLAFVFITSSVNASATQQLDTSGQVDELRLDQILKLENDSIQVERFIEFNNQKLLEESIDLEHNSFYQGNVMYPKDSTFKVVNLIGSQSGGATTNPYAENRIIRNSTLLKSDIPGEVFRIDKTGEKKYLIYADDFWRLGSDIEVYESTITHDSIKSTKTDQHGNYLFDLINKKVESHKNLPQEFHFDEQYSRKELLALGLNSAEIGANDYYKMVDQRFLSRQVEGLQFSIFYHAKYGWAFTKNLKVETDDTTFTRMLSGRIGDGQNVTRISTKFKNDSTFIETGVSTKTVKDNQHSMAYEIDSIVTLYRYDLKSNFTEQSSDTFHIYKEHPVFYPKLKDSTFIVLSSHFELNGLTCQWRSRVKYAEGMDANSDPLYVDVLRYDLVNLHTNEIILDSLVINDIDYEPRRAEISQLEISPSFYSSHLPNNQVDINFDGYLDFQFLTQFETSGQDGYDSYLFEPEKEVFQHSKILSGPPIIKLDKENNTAISQGGRLRLIRVLKTQFDENGEIVHQDICTREYLEKNKKSNEEAFIYRCERVIQGTVVDSKKKHIVPIGDLGYLLQHFYEWINDFN